MGDVEDFTDTEKRMIQSTVDERWAKDEIELHLADVEIKRNPDDTTLTLCPAIFWMKDDCNFVIIKTHAQRYRCQFFYKNDMEQLGTGIDEYDEIGKCVVTLLQTQADYDSVRSGAFPGKK